MDPVSRAQSVQGNAQPTRRPGGVTGKGFMPGRSGNPGGRSKKKHITELFERVLENKENIKEIEASVMETLKARGMAKVLMLREMAERTEGKIDQGIALSGLETVDAAIDAIRARKAKKNVNSNT